MVCSFWDVEEVNPMQGSNSLKERVKIKLTKIFITELENRISALSILLYCIWFYIKRG